MDKKNVKAVFIMPFYDNDIYEMLDTLNSIRFFFGNLCPVICINDCREKENIDLFEERSIGIVNVINFVPEVGPDWPRNGYGPLFCKIYQGVEYVLRHFKFDYLIKIDADALVTGSDFLEYLNKYFVENGYGIGLLGSYRTKADGKKRTMWRWALYLLFLVYVKKKLSTQSFLWKICLPKAKKNGYKLGESVLGGVYIFLDQCIKKIVELYPYRSIMDDKIYLTKVGEDVIFSLLAVASNYKLGDFGRTNDPLAIAQNCLPITKEEIIKNKKQIIHSLKKGLQGENQAELRAYFKSFRD